MKMSEKEYRRRLIEETRKRARRILEGKLRTDVGLPIVVKREEDE